uniref:Uncharacterized protein n=1 Tax=Brassica oleracea TaxID=3712 RepID=A0A3P6EDB7_BRAOL|nr:unnamed protein product [Brassica oleracea]
MRVVRLQGEQNTHLREAMTDARRGITITTLMTPKDHRSLSQRLHSYYQGIAKPREDIRREDSNSSKYQHGSTRGVPLEEKAHDHISKEAVETSMGELQDVMNLYLSCADPIESATRKDRVSSPEQGDQSQERIPATQRLSLPLSTDFSQERIPATQRLSIGPQPEAEQERVHVALRLGPTNADTVQGANQEIDTTVKRKPGRPPGKIRVQASPKTMVGSNSRRRITQQAKASLCRKKLIPEAGTSARIPKSKKQRTNTRAIVLQENEVQGSDNQLLSDYLPRRKKAADFHVPPSTFP